MYRILRIQKQRKTCNKQMRQRNSSMYSVQGWQKRASTTMQHNAIIRQAFSKYLLNSFLKLFLTTQLTVLFSLNPKSVQPIQYDTFQPMYQHCRLLFNILYKNVLTSQTNTMCFLRARTPRILIQVSVKCSYNFLKLLKSVNGLTTLSVASLLNHPTCALVLHKTHFSVVKTGGQINVAKHENMPLLSSWESRSQKDKFLSFPSQMTWSSENSGTSALSWTHR